MATRIPNIGGADVETEQTAARVALATLRRERPRMHQLSWAEYMGPEPRVISEEEFSPEEREIIARTEGWLRWAFQDAHRDPRRYGLIGAARSDLRCLVRGPVLMLISEDASTLYGGIADGMTFIMPEHRGQGLSKELHLAIDGSARCWLAPTHFSTGGFGARQAAHRTAVERAHQDGLPDIHPDNLVRYLGQEPDEPVPAFAF